MTSNTQSEIVAFLSDPATYGVSEPVERIETHISVVFLAGERAYKLKRAVRFPYLDYAEVETRRVFCQREVEINRRTAPEIYEASVPVVRTREGSLALDGEGEAVDWVVVMKRFDQESLWDSIARRDGLTPPMVNRLADRIADFHANAEVHRDRGGALSLRRVIDQNEEELGRHTPDVFDVRSVERLGAASRAALDRVTALADGRAASGSVRHCHGDLHLRNICQFGGEPTLFDAIEFSDDIAVIDVLYDLAFLIMDMEHRGLGFPAGILLNRYLSATRDYDGLAALPLFLSLRAAIRSHVTAAAASADDRPDDRDAKVGEARDYLTLALSLLEPARPCLIAAGGYSGSGKSTLARVLAPEIGPVPGAVHLQSDTIRKRLADVAPETRLSEEHYSDEMSAKVYARIREDASRALAGGYSVIADATYLDAGERHWIENVAREAGVAFIGLWLDVPTEAMEKRLTARRGDASDAVVEILHRQLESGPVETDWRVIEAAGDVAATRRATERVLNREGIATRRRPRHAGKGTA